MHSWSWTGDTRAGTAEGGDAGPVIGFLGTGRMGLPMCANLTAAGYDVLAHDRRPEAESEVIACGARWARTAAGVAAESDIPITMLPGPPEVTQVMLGPGNALDALPEGATWIDMSSNVDAAAEPIRARAALRGIDVLEAPVGGGSWRPGRDRSKLFVGGRTEVLQRCRAVLAVVGDPGRLVHGGGPGAGYTTKLIVNLLWFGQAVATAEALLLGKRSGVSRAPARCGRVVRSPLLLERTRTVDRRRWPRPAVPRRRASGRTPVPISARAPAVPSPSGPAAAS